MEEMNQKKWTKKMNKFWLQSRMLDTDGLAVELRNQVSLFLKDKNCPQQIFKKEGSTPEDVMHMVTSLSSVLAHAMDPHIDETKIEYVDKSIRIFLTYLDRVDNCLREGKGSPIWSTSYSYMCLMNIPMVLKKYGSLRNLWEGGYRGEGIIKRVKPIVHQFTTHWHVRLMENFYQNRSIELIINELEQTNKSIFSMNMYYIYKSMEELNSAILTKRRPISVIIDDLGEIYACVKGDSLCKIMVVEYFHQCFGLHYFIFHNTDTIIERSVESVNIEYYGLLLPLLVDGKQKRAQDLDNYKGIFSLITSEWKEMSKDRLIKTNTVLY